MKNKKLIILFIILLLVITGYKFYNRNSSDTESQNKDNKNIVENYDKTHGEHAKDKNEKKEVIITEITADGYACLHGDHLHFEK